MYSEARKIAIEARNWWILLEMQFKMDCLKGKGVVAFVVTSILTNYNAESLNSIRDVQSL